MQSLKEAALYTLTWALFFSIPALGVGGERGASLGLATAWVGALVAAALFKMRAQAVPALVFLVATVSLLASNWWPAARALGVARQPHDGQHLLLGGTSGVLLFAGIWSAFFVSPVLVRELARLLVGLLRRPRNAS
jgi:hypothetical protein